MYSTQKTGYLELELADFKDLRRYRIGAIDHGLFSFNDVTLNQWPVIVITNPKAALFSMPNSEPLQRIAKSTHIRALAFSKSDIHSVQARIEGDDWIDMKHISGPLYAVPWNPSKYAEGLHWLSIKATDNDMNSRIVKHQFSLDGSKPEFTFGGRFMLRGRVQTIVRKRKNPVTF